jgi:hypothetical protein
LHPADNAESQTHRMPVTSAAMTPRAPDESLESLILGPMGLVPAIPVVTRGNGFRSSFTRFCRHGKGRWQLPRVVQAGRRGRSPY